VPNVGVNRSHCHELAERFLEILDRAADICGCMSDIAFAPEAQVMCLFTGKAGHQTLPIREPSPSKRQSAPKATWLFEGFPAQDDKGQPANNHCEPDHLVPVLARFNLSRLMVLTERLAQLAVYLLCFSDKNLRFFSG